MSDIRIEIPASLGLSDEDTAKLVEAFRSQLVGTINAALARTVTPARPQTVVQSRPETSVKECGQSIEASRT